MKPIMQERLNFVKDITPSFESPDQKIVDLRKLKWLKYLMKFFLVVAGVSQVLQIVMFTF